MSPKKKVVTSFVFLYSQFVRKGNHLTGPLYHHIMDIPSAASIYQGITRTPLALWPSLQNATLFRVSHSYTLCSKSKLASIRISWRQLSTRQCLVLLIISRCVDLHIVVVLLLVIIPRIGAIIILLFIILTQSRDASPSHIIILNPSQALW